MVTIFLKKQTESNKLFLFDTVGNCGDSSITTAVVNGEKVVWKLAKNSGIDQIDNVFKKHTSQDIFSTDPAENAEGKYWEGMISETSKGSEGYNISYSINGEEYTDDPELEVKDDGDGDS
ncbi:MAG: hypothetical protein CMO01_20145 [Thalassobius sp.]|nr:hypothetical protein [Thalassovita sp.]|tara:strand:+ start:229 stop:588 length:360 start_codon:yes stop_codon:yes gene_type:complete